ncbi:MAG: hypothetical protein GY749_00860 [Desulfobacteraceae bacterium]|nr:hypothetical protein [Desulfobacteraceae bacterium]
MKHFSTTFVALFSCIFMVLMYPALTLGSETVDSPQLIFPIESQSVSVYADEDIPFLWQDPYAINEDTDRIYRLAISENESLDEPIVSIVIEGSEENSATVSPSELNLAGSPKTYYWRITKLVEGIEVAQSDIQSFMTETEPTYINGTLWGKFWCDSEFNWYVLSLFPYYCYEIADQNGQIFTVNPDPGSFEYYNVYSCSYPTYTKVPCDGLVVVSNLE